VDAERPGGLEPPIDDRIRAAGLRSTRQRLTVLSALDSIPGHRSADELVGDLADRGTALPRSTVFNVLDDLAEAGLVLRTDLGPGACRYESALSREPHHHFVCRGCGTIEDVPSTGTLAQLGAPVLLPGSEVEAVEVVFRGRCRRCRQAHGSRDASWADERPD
jgi:Fe2+ or Zn2+ uptake regulation protein